MKHIEKIIINNARRFGENIEIDFGVGATIILAPNGIGKTTVFEAMEFALTGDVKRLEGSLSAFIKDKLSVMSTRLEFSGGKYCQVDYAKGEESVLRGNHDELFSVENEASLPYLFRLTHFLEQRGVEWFVGKDETDAGNSLSMLPTGKDLQRILSKKKSLITLVRRAETDAETQLITGKEKLSDFEKLKAKKDTLAMKTALVPLKELVAKLFPIAELIDYEVYVEEHYVTQINSYFEKIKIALQQENFAKKDLSVKLTKLKERVLLYASNLELLKQKEKIIAEHTQKADELSPTIETNKKELQDLNENLSTIKEEIKKLNSTKSTFEEVEKEVKDIKAKKTEFEKNRKLLESLNKSNKEISEYLKKNERLRDQHKLANDAITTKKKLLTQMEQKKDFQKQWEDILKINQQLFEKIMPELEKRKNACLKSKSLVDKEVSDLDKIYLIKNKRLESLNVASGAIQDAVARIRKHLSADQRDCPVCQSTYEPEVLINRIEKSLNALNPEIPIAIADEKEALEVLGTAKEKLKKENQEISKIESELKIEQDKLDTNKNKITEVFLPQFLDCKTSEDAQKYIKDNIKEISTQINELTDNKNKFDSEVTSDALSEAKLKKSEFERLIKELSTKTETAKNEIDNETEKINNLTKVLSDKNKEKVLADIVSKSTDQKQKTESIQKLEVVINKNEIQFKEYQKVLISEKESISKIKGNQEGICAEWRQVKLESQPSVETLKTKQEIVLKNIDELERANIPLNSVEQELANWRAAEKYSEADKEVKKQIGDFSEDDYLKGLKSSIDKNKKRLDSVQKKKMTVEAFLDNAKEESEKITEQLNAINTPWKGLLKRIVINPLISEAPLLNSTISRNSQKASTFANLHEENFSMDKIASEAQLTDLQLTFMLAMANKYQWTPWKALLLDDPTQHHDLVHASSVFDVLRDYIIDLDYQVLMSTHDSVQAKFFQRKLENEGVLSKIYQLVARKGGVTAERMM